MPQPTMDSVGAAHTIAKHIKTLIEEFHSIDKYLSDRALDGITYAEISVLFATATGLRPSSSREDDKEVEVLKARRRCAQMVVEALLIAKEHCDGPFQALIEEELKTARAEPIFEVLDEQGDDRTTLAQELERLKRNMERRKVRASYCAMQEKEEPEAGRTSRLAVRTKEEYEAARTGAWDDQAEEELEEGEILED